MLSPSPNRDILDEVLAGALIVLSIPCWVGAVYVAHDGMIFATLAWLVLALAFAIAAISVLRDPPR